MNKITAPPVRGLKIAFIGARGVVGTYSGIETYYEEVGSRLAERGHEVTAYCRNYFTPPILDYRGVRVRRLPAIRGKHLETISHSVLATIDSLWRDFDIIQYHAIGSAFLALIPRLLRRGTTVVSVRGLDWQRAKWGPFAKGVLRMGEWASAHCPAATAVVSETLQRHYRAVHGKETTLLPNAVSLGQHRPLAKTARFQLEKDGYLLYAGRLSPEKGIHTLLEALRPLPRHKKLVLAGGTSYSDTYVQQIRDSAWNEVLFLGRVDHEMMEELYSNCYAFILPSAMEGLSIALLEALSFGACIITTDIPENLEVIGSAGLSFPYGDVEALRAVLAQILQDKAIVERYRKLASDRARAQPGWDEIATRTEAFYLELLGASLSQTARRPPVTR